MKRKGITPVIATVLLLGITLAIGLTLYTQVQGLLGGSGDQSQKLQNIQGTEMKLNPTYDQSGQIMLNVVNTGDQAINVSQFSAYYGPGDYDNPVPYSVLKGTEHTVSANDNQCFKSEFMSGDGIVNPGESFNCKTGIKFPGALQEVKISVEADSFDKSWTTSCVPQTSSSKSC